MEKEKKIKMTAVFDLLQSAIKTWWKNLSKFFLLYIWGIAYAAIPIAVLLLLVGVGYFTSLWENSYFAIVASFICLWAVIFIVYYSIRVYLSMFLLIKHNYAKKELEIYKESANYFWSYITLIFLTLILLALWFMALFVPALIFAIFYTFACYAFIFEGKRDIDAIRRSRELVAGYWWAVLGRFILLGIVLMLFIMIISLPLQFLSPSGVGAAIWNIVVQIINYLVGPIGLIFTYLMYQDLVKIKK